MKRPADPPPSHATAETRAESWDAMLAYVGLAPLKRKTSRGHGGASPWKGKSAACQNSVVVTSGGEFAKGPR